MTIRQYIVQKLPMFSLSDADLAGLHVDVEAEYDDAVKSDVGKALCALLEEKVLSPRVSNVNENGFSMSWDFSKLGNYYKWLCSQYGVTPDGEVLAMMGISSIRDVTEMW